MPGSNKFVLQRYVIISYARIKIEMAPDRDIDKMQECWGFTH